MPEELSLLPPEQAQEAPLSLYPPGQADRPVSGMTARNRAVKFNMALGMQSPGVDSLENSIVTGQEQAVRDHTSTTTMMEARNRARMQLSEAALMGADPSIVVPQVQSQIPTVNPTTIMEDQFSQRFLEGITTTRTDPGSVAVQAVNDDPAGTTNTFNSAKWILTKRQIAAMAAENVEARTNVHMREVTENVGNILGGVYNVAHHVGTMLPGVSAAARSPSGISFGETLSRIFAPGTSMEAERIKYWSILDPVEAAIWLDGRIREIEKWNPVDAVTYAREIVKFSHQDRLVSNVFGALDLDIPVSGTMVAGKAIVGGAMGGYASRAAYRKLLRDGIEAVGEDGTLSTVKIHAATGNLDKAGDVLTVKKILADRDPVGAMEAIFERLASWVNPSTGHFIQPSASLAGDRAMKMDQTIVRNRIDLTQRVLGTLRIPRVTEETIVPMLAEVKDRILKQYPHINDHTLDVRPIYDPALNVWYGEVIVGRRDGTLFQSVKQATRAALEDIGLPLEAFKVGNLPSDAAKFLHGEAIARGIPDINVVGDKIQGFKSIQGTVRLKDGTEIKVSNKADGIYSLETGVKGVNIKVDPQDIAAYKNAGKASKWTDVVSEHRPLTSAEVKQQGAYYYVSIMKPMDETDVMARQVLTMHLNNQNPNSVGGAFVDMLASSRGLDPYAASVAKSVLAGVNTIRTAEELLSNFMRNNRHLATHIAPEVQRIMSEKAVAIGGLPRRSREQLRRVLEINRDHEEKGVVGIRWNSQARLDEEWLKANGRQPTARESFAYWTYHDLMDMDYVLRNMGVGRDLLRQGVEQIHIRLGDETALGKDFDFPGRISDLDRFFNSRTDPGLMIIDGQNPVRHFFKDALKAEVNRIDREAIKDLEKNGFKVIEVAFPLDKPFEKHTGLGNTVNFVLIKEVETRPLRLDLVTYNPGVHVMYMQEHFVKVPIIEKGEKGLWRYYGDKTVLGAYTEKEAVRQSDALNTVQRMINEGADDAALNTFIHGNLPEDAAFWRKQFNEHIGLTHPIRAVHSGRQVMEQYPELKKNYGGKDFVNERNSEHNLARTIEMDYIADRDTKLYSIQRTGGTAEEPVYTRVAAKIYDPYVALERGINNAIRNLHLNDAKIGAIEQWASQYAKYIDGVDATANPFQAFFFGKLNPNVAGEVGRAEYNAALNTQQRIKNFLGTQTEFGREISRLQIAVMNAKDYPGEELKAARYRENENTFALKHFTLLTDPIDFTRKFMYHVYFGLGNISQFAIQSQGWSTVSGILIGAHGVPAGTKMTVQAMAAYGATVGRYLTRHPNIEQHLESMMQKMGWKEGQFTESHNLMRNIGWDIIGAEQAMREASFDPKIWINGADKFLEWGAAPFREGERLTRVVSWHGAYLEWRRANPYKTLDNYAAGDILRRADDLSANMTRASSSRLQEGNVRVATQFYTFSQRMMELYNGKRLTNQEKAGMFVMHSLLYGVPVAASVPTLVLPVAEKFREYSLLSGNSQVHEGYWKGITQGFMSYMLWHLTGEDYNTEQKYGPGVQDRIYKAITGESSPLGIALGATGDTLHNMGRSLEPFMMAAYTRLTNKDRQFQLQSDHLLGLLKNIQSANTAMNAWYAINTGKYLARNQDIVSDRLTLKDGVALLGGLVPRHVADTRVVREGLKDQQDAQRRGAEFAKTEIRLAYKHMADSGDINKYTYHMNNAHLYLEAIVDYKPDEIHKVFNDVRTERGSQYERAKQMYYERGYASQLRLRSGTTGF